jgi:hypothetical protein
VAAASNTKSTANRRFLANWPAYSCTSAKVASVVSISSIAWWRSTRIACPPINADSRTLAPAASFTTSFPPGLEIGQDFFFGYPALPDLSRDFGAQLLKEIALQVKRKHAFG